MRRKLQPPTATQVVPTLSIQPSEVLIDEPTSIRLSGFEANQKVTIRATTVGTAFPDLIDTGIVRESQATFQTDANGFTCADTYHAFNGPDGLKPIAGVLTASKANGHPSDKGNEIIASTLADLGYAPLVP